MSCVHGRFCSHVFQNSIVRCTEVHDYSIGLVSCNFHQCVNITLFHLKLFVFVFIQY